MMSTILSTVNRKQFFTKPDAFDVYVGYSTIIPFVEIFKNDIDKKNNIPFTIIEVFDSYGGTAIINNTNVIFTSTGNVNEPAGFKYKVMNSINKIATGTISMNILPLPDIIPYSDTFDVIQGQDVLINFSSLINNDIDPAGLYPLTVTNVHSPYGGTLSLNGSTITFTSTNITGQPAGFKYDVKNSANKIATGDVFINVQPLPDIEAYIWSSTDQLNNSLETITPLTPLEIFNNWDRIDGNNYYIKGDTYSSNAAAWQFITDPDRFIMPLNVSPYCGFISPEKLDNFTLTAKVTSNDADNDLNGLIIACVRENNINHVLYAARTQGGTAPNLGWGILYAQDSTYAAQMYFNISVGGNQGGWTGRYSKIKIERNNDIIKCYCSGWNDENLEISSELVLNLNNFPELAKFKGKQSYGYISYSQANSTYLESSLTGNLNTNKIYNIETNEVLIWNETTSQWNVSSTTIQDELGYPRYVTNPKTNERFYIEQNKITLIS